MWTLKDSLRLRAAALSVSCLLLATTGCHHKKPVRVVETPRDLTLIRWCAVVDEDAGRQLAALPNQRITTEGYTGKACSTAGLMQIMTQAAAEKRILHIGAIRGDSFNTQATVARADTWTSLGTIKLNLAQAAGQPGRQQVIDISCMGAGNIQAHGTQAGASVAFDYTSVSATITDKSPSNPPGPRLKIAGSVRYDGTLGYDNSLIALGRIGVVAGRNYDYVVVWQAAESPTGLLDELKALRENAEPGVARQ